MNDQKKDKKEKLVVRKETLEELRVDEIDADGVTEEELELIKGGVVPVSSATPMSNI